MAARLLLKSLHRRPHTSDCHTPITYPPLIPHYLHHHQRHHSSKPPPTKTNVSPSPSSSFTFSSSPCPLYFHYEDVMRQDLLLKLNYDNIMEVPQLSAARVVPKAAIDRKDVNLAVEIPCGQKVIQTEKDSKGNVVRSRSMSSAGKKGSTNTIARQITLRGQGMSNFLVRMLTVMSLLDSPAQIQGNYIRFLADTEFLEFAPELEDHFEILEHIRGFNVTVVTSANTQDETKLLWSGFMQKDKRET